MVNSYNNNEIEKSIKDYPFRAVCCETLRWIYGKSYSLRDEIPRKIGEKRKDHFINGEYFFNENGDKIEYKTTVRVFSDSVSKSLKIVVNYRKPTEVYTGDILIYNNRDKYLVCQLYINGKNEICLLNINEKCNRDEEFEFSIIETETYRDSIHYFGVKRRYVDVKMLDWLEKNKKHIRVFSNKFDSPNLVENMCTNVNLY